MPTYTKETALYDTGAIDAGITGAGQTAGKYITAIDNSGIRVHAESNPNVNYSKIDGSGLEVFKGTSISDSKSVAKFGDSVRIGEEQSQRVVIDRSGFYVLDAEDTEQFAVNAQGSTVTDEKAVSFTAVKNSPETETYAIPSGTSIKVTLKGFSTGGPVSFSDTWNTTAIVRTFSTTNPDVHLAITAVTNNSTTFELSTTSIYLSYVQVTVKWTTSYIVPLISTIGDCVVGRKATFGALTINGLAPFTTFTATGTVTLNANSGESVTVTGTVPTGYTPIAVQSIETAHNQTCLIGKFTLTSNGASITLRNVSSSKYTKMSVTATILCTSL